MTTPPTIEEQDEIAALAVLCEEKDRRDALLAELVRLRAFASVCRRHSGRLPRAVQLTLQTKVPKRSNSVEWAHQVAESADIDDPRQAGTSPRLL